MNPVSLFLITIAAIFLIGIFGEIIFKRTQVPDVLWLLLVGILLGPVAGIVSRGQLGAIAPFFGALTLVVILFDGGSKLDLAGVARAAPRSGLLAVLSFLSAVGVVAVASMGARSLGWLPATWTWQYALLLGAILGGSSSIIIMPAMQLAGVPPKIANLLNLESAFTDAFCIVGTALFIDLMLQVGGAGRSPGGALMHSLGIGLGMGLVTGFFWLILLRVLQVSEHAYPITLSALLLLYVAIDQTGGSAAIGILAFAIVVGNARHLGRRLGFGAALDLGRDVRGFNRQLSFIIKSFFFTFMGAMLGPPWSQVLLGALLGVLLLAARVPAVWLVVSGKGFQPGDRAMALVSLPRGMAAGVLATFPTAAGIPGTERFPNLVFAGALVSILIFAIGFPRARRAMDLIPSTAGGPPAPAGAAPASPAVDDAPPPHTPAADSQG